MHSIGLVLYTFNRIFDDLCYSFGVLRNEVTVPKFLISHLAFADLCLGLYLLLIASIDIHSMGEYFNFAYDWQYGTYADLIIFFLCVKMDK